MELELTEILNTPNRFLVLDVGTLFNENAKINDISLYLDKIEKLPLSGKNVILTGKGPIWLYLKIAHHLHGSVMSLSYDSPVTGKITVFDHSPF